MMAAVSFGHLRCHAGELFWACRWAGNVSTPGAMRGTFRSISMDGEGFPHRVPCRERFQCHAAERFGHLDGRGRFSKPGATQRKF